MAFRVLRARKLIKDMRILATAKTELENVKREIQDRIDNFAESKRRLVTSVTEGETELIDWELRFDGYEISSKYDKKIINKIEDQIEAIQREIRQYEATINEFSEEEIKNARNFNMLVDEDGKLKEKENSDANDNSD